MTGAELDKKIDHQQRLIEILAKLVARAWVISRVHDEETEADFESWRMLVDAVWRSGAATGFGPDIVTDSERWEKEFEADLLVEMGIIDPDDGQCGICKVFDRHYHEWEDPRMVRFKATGNILRVDAAMMF